MYIKNILLLIDFVNITNTIDDKVNVPLIKKYFEEYDRTIMYNLPKEYYIGYIKGIYNQMKKEVKIDDNKK